MPYSQFTIEKVKQDFHLTTVEGVRFFPDSIEPVTLSNRLQNILEELPWAIAVDNEAKGQAIPVVYGTVTSGTQWRFLKLEGQTITIDLMDYSLPPVELILSFLVWMLKAD
ncbi:MAG: hypothetical protein KME21_09505 [Desmonostoc vinosum HA7617-LM4]|jgi:hypothetical protein|nr:hypothetical protein [Desmonostoc vinosum HA7617-LM4]